MMSARAVRIRLLARAARRSGLLVLGISALVLLSAPRPAAAQTGRAALLQGNEAYDFAEFDTAIGLLQLGLDPGAGPPDSLWAAGVHKLVHALLESGREPLANTWLRWALRRAPDLPVDSLNFPPSVVAAFRAAQRFVGGSRQPALLRTTWQWPTRPPADTSGTVVMEGGEISTSGRIEGGGSLAPGVPQTVPAGSYTVLATAEGYLPARATVEVLPGVTTVLRFNLEPAAAGLLYVASRPWGTVFVNGQRIGYTAISGYRLPAGTHRVRVERPGYLPFDTTITVSQRDQELRLGPIVLLPERR